jgi:formylglycine-generating enzyme required for sulfatase activity
MVQIPVNPGNSFQMGKNLGTVAGSDVTPLHMVTLTSSFYMGKYEVTQEQWQAVMGNNPSYFTSSPALGEVQEKRPVECVSWYDAIEFCNALSIMEGLTPYYTIDKVNQDPNNSNSMDNLKWTVTRSGTANGYRLPTEAQWEYAAKGGDQTVLGWVGYTYAGSNTVGDVAWYSSNSNYRTHEAGKKSPNGLGLYDMSGNVWEWCWDWPGNYPSEAQTDPTGAASGSSRVNRGGDWGNNESYSRSVFRNTINHSDKMDCIGFRLVRP